MTWLVIEFVVCRSPELTAGRSAGERGSYYHIQTATKGNYANANNHAFQPTRNDPVVARLSRV